MNERSVMMLKLVSIHVILPVVMTVAAFFVHNDAFLVNIVAQTILLVVYLAGYWEFFGLRFRRLFPLLLEIILLAQFVSRARTTTIFRYNIYFADVLFMVELFLIIQLIRIVVVMRVTDRVKLEIHFPFKDGKFLITDGGNGKVSGLMNYHYNSAVHRKNHMNKSMLFATDIVNASLPYPSFMPRENTDYPIFGEAVFSPIDGTVVKVENSMPDNRPYAGEYPYNTGNTVVIRRNDLYLLLGHLKEGSVTVQVGDNILAGQQIAQAGNSGMSERPHIHIQLMKSETDNYWAGSGICVQFKGINLYKNRLIEA